MILKVHSRNQAWSKAALGVGLRSFAQDVGFAMFSLKKRRPSI